MLKVFYQVLTCQQPSSDIPRTFDVLNTFTASDKDPVIEANGGLHVSSPRDVAKEKYRLPLLKSIKSTDQLFTHWMKKSFSNVCWFH